MLARPQHDRQRGSREQREPRRHGDRELGEQRNRHADGRGDRGGGDGDAVGGQRGERDGVGDGEQDRRDAELRAGGRTDQQRERARDGQPAGERGAGQQDTRGRQDRQREAELAGQQRIDQQEQHRGDRERVPCVVPASGRLREQHERRHHAGAQDGRLSADEHDEPQQRCQGEATAATRAEPGERRRADDAAEDQRDVGARHRHEVGQASCEELGLGLRRQPAGVAGHQARQQGRVVGGQTRDGRGPDAVAHDGGRGEQRVWRRDAAHRRHGVDGDAGVEPPHVRVEAVTFQRSGGGAEGDVGAQRGCGVKAVGAQQRSLADTPPVQGRHADEQPRAVLRRAGLGDRGRAHVCLAAARGQTRQGAGLDECRAPACQAAAEHQERCGTDGQPCRGGTRCAPPPRGRGAEQCRADDREPPGAGPETARP